MKHNLNPVMNAQLDRNRRFKGHRRNLSDPRFSTSLTDAYGEDQVCIFWQNVCLVGKQIGFICVHILNIMFFN